MSSTEPPSKGDLICHRCPIVYIQDHALATIQRVVRNADGSALYLGAMSDAKYPISYVYRSTDNGLTWTSWRFALRTISTRR